MSGPSLGSTVYVTFTMCYVRLLVATTSSTSTIYHMYYASTRKVHQGHGARSGPTSQLIASRDLPIAGILVSHTQVTINIPKEIYFVPLDTAMIIHIFFVEVRG